MALTKRDEAAAVQLAYDVARAVADGSITSVGITHRIDRRALGIMVDFSAVTIVSFYDKAVQVQGGPSDYLLVNAAEMMPAGFALRGR